MGRRIQPNRHAVWRIRTFRALDGRVRDTAIGYAAGHWRVMVRQRWHHWEMWYPATQDGLARAQRQRRNADALR